VEFEGAQIFQYIDPKFRQQTIFLAKLESTVIEDSDYDQVQAFSYPKEDSSSKSI